MDGKLERLLDFSKTTCPRCLRKLAPPVRVRTYRRGAWLYAGYEQGCACGLERGFNRALTLAEMVRWVLRAR